MHCAQLIGLWINNIGFAAVFLAIFRHLAGLRQHVEIMGFFHDFSHCV
ncbi:hypothetical protein CORMATOL_00881 [Corynebacterium matruchotii ATCC 33806]|uniref:Uncharacterized protein n=1 Tax=Corynebacterium matruchotii ATCC 33806 TaxID=566549 RepID=C0E1N0_9CORY|nr:hypothetical protein CORMATOL_00881 [Corynebacterium matruchotii ATCC 33806]